MGQNNRLPVSATGGDSVALRHLPRRDAEIEATDGTSDGNRSGLWSDPLQFGPRSDDFAFALLISFTRNLVRGVVGGDALFLALSTTQKETGASKEQIQTLHDALIGYWKRNNIWPDGF
jgi:hypothetical protein